MTLIKTTRAVGGHEPGTEIDTTEGAAQYLIDNDYAEAVEKPTRKAKGKTQADPDTTPENGEGGGASPAYQGTTAG